MFVEIKLFLNFILNHHAFICYYKAIEKTIQTGEAMHDNTIKEYHGKVVQEFVKGDDSIDGKLYYEIVILNIENGIRYYKTFRLYEPKECSYKNKTVFIQYYSKKSDYLEAFPDVNYACLSKKDYYDNYITTILIDQEVKQGIIFLPIHNIIFASFLSGFYSTYYVIEGIENLKFHKKKMVFFDDVNNHIDYNKDVIYIFDDYYDMLSDKYLMKFLSSNDKGLCGFAQKEPSFIINDGKLYIGKSLWNNIGNITDFSQPLTMRYLNYILKEIKGYQPKKIEYFLDMLKTYKVVVSHTNDERKSTIKKNNNVISLNKTEDTSISTSKRIPFQIDINDFFVNDVCVIATSNHMKGQKIYFTNINSDLVSSFNHHNDDVGNQLRLSYPDNRMLFVYRAKDRGIKGATPLYIINKKGFFYGYNKGIINRLKKYLEINQIKKITSDYVNHLENENSHGYYTKKIINDSLSSNKKLSKKDKKNQFEKLEKFFKS